MPVVCDGLVVVGKTIAAKVLGVDPGSTVSATGNCIFGKPLRPNNEWLRGLSENLGTAAGRDLLRAPTLEHWNPKAPLCGHGGGPVDSTGSWMPIATLHQIAPRGRTSVWSLCRPSGLAWDPVSCGNQCAFGHFDRSVPVNVSFNPSSLDSPGRERSVATSQVWSHRSGSREVNAQRLPIRIFFG